MNFEGNLMYVNCIYTGERKKIEIIYKKGMEKRRQSIYYTEYEESNYERH